MNVKDSKSSGLDRVAEEFELRNRIKRLQGKTIKLKRIVRRPEGSKAEESSGNCLSDLNSSNQVDRSMISEVGADHVSNDRVIFVASSVPELPSSAFKKQKESQTRLSEADDLRERQSLADLPKESLKARVPVDQDTSLAQPAASKECGFKPSAKTSELRRTRMSEHRARPMPLGIERVAKGEGVSRSSDLDIFKLPISVKSLVERGPEELNRVRKALKAQEIELDKVFDDIEREMLQALNAEKQRMREVFRAFDRQFAANLQVFEQRYRDFKDTESWIPRKKFKEPQIIQIDRCEFVDNALFVTLREDQAQLLVPDHNLEKVLDRCILGFVAESIEGQACRLPTFNKSSTAQEFTDSLKSGLATQVAGAVSQLDRLLCASPIQDLSNIGIRWKGSLLLKKVEAVNFKEIKQSPIFHISESVKAELDVKSPSKQEPASFAVLPGQERKKDEIDTIASIPTSESLAKPPSVI